LGAYLNPQQNNFWTAPRLWKYTQRLVSNTGHNNF